MDSKKAEQAVKEQVCDKVETCIQQGVAGCFAEEPGKCSNAKPVTPELAECVYRQPTECPSAFPFGYSYFCSCPTVSKYFRNNYNPQHKN